MISQNAAISSFRKAERIVLEAEHLILDSSNSLGLAVKDGENLSGVSRLYRIANELGRKYQFNSMIENFVSYLWLERGLLRLTHLIEFVCSL